MTATAPELSKVTDELFASIAMLLEKRHERSALILLYSAIDILGALDTSSGHSTRSSFISWADKYMDPPRALGCSSLELYSARCGLLHALSSETKFTATGVARDFVYVSYPPVFAEESAADHRSSCTLAIFGNASALVSESSSRTSSRIRRALRLSSATWFGCMSHEAQTSVRHNYVWC